MHIRASIGHLGVCVFANELHRSIMENEEIMIEFLNEERNAREMKRELEPGTRGENASIIVEDNISEYNQT